MTHPRIDSPATTARAALDQVEAWTESPSVLLLGETEGYWPILRDLVARGSALGAQIHDARVAALCRLHGVGEIWTMDRDFSRFAGIRARNPHLEGDRRGGRGRPRA